MMIINPILAAAAVANTASTIVMSHLPSNDGYFTEIENYNHNDIHRQKRELDEFTAHPPCAPHETEDSEITSGNQQAVAAAAAAAKRPPPPLPDTNSPFQLLGLAPGADFDVVRGAYKDLAKLYHPDVVVRPDASAEEQRTASWDFARVNAAYDILKRTNDEEESLLVKYNAMVNRDGERGARSAVSVAVSEERRQRGDPYPTTENNDIMVRRRKRQPKRTTWRERYSSHRSSMHSHSSENYVVSRHSPGKWRAGTHVLEHEDYNWQEPRRNEFESSSKNQAVSVRTNKKWGEAEQQQTYSSRPDSTNGFGVINPRQGQWWNDEQPFLTIASPLATNMNIRQRIDNSVQQ